jgi:hypothetical protein
VSNSDDAAATVAPLVALWERVADMRDLQRWARTLELMERALELARRILPPHSLVTAWSIGGVVTHRVFSGNEVTILSADTSASVAGICGQAWASDSCLKAMSFERLAVCCARLEAGTLFTPTPEELAFFGALHDRKITNLPLLERLGEEILLSATHHAMVSCTTALTSTCDTDTEEAAVLMAGVDATLQTALSLDARDELQPWLRKRALLREHLPRIVNGAQREITALHMPWPLARPSFFVASPENEAALDRLQARLKEISSTRGYEPPRSDNPTTGAWQERAAADVARHGLNTCALPACGATEPHPRFFKCCSRCHSAWYCSPEHEREDWPRHRRADQCTKAEAS